MTSNSLTPKEQVMLMGADCDELPVGTRVTTSEIGKKYYNDKEDGGEPRCRLEVGIVVETRGNDVRVQAVEPADFFSDPLMWFMRGALEKKPYVVRELL